MTARVWVHVVTFNSERTIAACLSSVVLQQGFALGKDFSISVTDNASTDGTRGVVEEQFGSQVTLIENEKNTGFCEAHNQLIGGAVASGAEFVLVLNPDVRLKENALRNLVLALEADPRAGFATPKLLRADGALQAVEPPQLDAAGMYITPQIRHFDRGSGELDIGQFSRPEYVFGATGAALLIRRACARDISLTEDDAIEVFDEAYFAYREDADMAWRAQWLGWKVRYVPEAVGYHERLVLPERRAKLPARINELGVQNRFLLQLNNFSFFANAGCLIPTTLRNIGVVGYTALNEQTSLKALKSVYKLLPRALSRRRRLFRRRRVAAGEVSKWFQRQPYVEPALAERPSKQPVKTVEAIVVNYNSGARLKACILSLLEFEKALPGGARILHITVIDNDSSDGSAEKAKKQFEQNKNVSFELGAVNLGFAAAINNAARLSESDAVLVLNPDIVLAPATVAGLCDRLDSYRLLGAVAPLLCDAGGLPQLGYLPRAFRRVSHSLAELFYLHQIWPGNPWTSRLYRRSDAFLDKYCRRELSENDSPFESLERPLVVEQPAAACLCIRRAAFNELGGFDEQFWPAWFEDVDFSVRLRQAGWLAALDSSLTATHAGGYSREQLSPSNYARAWYPNMLRFHRKRSAAPGYLLFRVGLPLALLLRALVSFLDGLLPGPRGEVYGKKQRALSRTLVRLALNADKEHRRFGEEDELNNSSLLDDLSLHVTVTRMRDSLRRKASQLLLTDGKLKFAVPALPLQGQLGNGIARESNRDWRVYFTSMLRGDGIELGPLHRPMIRHEKMQMTYVDRLTVEALREQYPELKDEQLVEPDIIDDAETLPTVEDASFDFLIAAHVIEHMRNPLGSLKEWRRVVKPGGRIYLVVPDKRYTFDRPRVRTTLEHMVLDYKRPSAVRDIEHFLDYSTHVGRLAEDAALVDADSRIGRDYSIHFHVFVPDDLVSLINWFSQNIEPLKIIEGPCKAPGSDEFHLLLER